VVTFGVIPDVRAPAHPIEGCARREWSGYRAWYLGLGGWGSGFEVQGSEFRVWGLGSWRVGVRGLGFGVFGVGVWDLGFEGWGLGFRV
jgi:hypothetical protein